MPNFIQFLSIQSDVKLSRSRKNETNFSYETVVENTCTASSILRWDFVWARRMHCSFGSSHVPLPISSSFCLCLVKTFALTCLKERRSFLFNENLELLG